MKSFVVVPTYNESANIERLLREILALGVPDLHVLVVDDRSPDGTAAIAGRLAAEHPLVHVAERVNDKGRGTAGIVGFDLALQLGAEAIVEMDADFSHPPAELPRLLAALADVDIAIASRLAPGAVDTRPVSRRAVTRFANRYARAFLERPFHRSRVLDWTTGFRAYRREVLRRIPPSSLVSRGPSILQELLFRALNGGFTARELPFTMKDREAGVSTFSRRVARQSLLSIPCYRVMFGDEPRAGENSVREFNLGAFIAAERGPRQLEVRREELPARGPAPTGVRGITSNP